MISRQLSVHCLSQIITWHGTSSLQINQICYYSFINHFNMACLNKKLFRGERKSFYLFTKNTYNCFALEALISMYRSVRFDIMLITFYQKLQKRAIFLTCIRMLTLYIVSMCFSTIIS